MTVSNNSIDECGTGRHTPPPLYQDLSTQHGLNYVSYLLDPRNSSHTDFRNSNELIQILRNTRKSAESVIKIRQMMEVEDGVTNTLKGICRLLEVQDGITNSFIPIFSFILIIQLIFSFINLMSMPYSSISRVNELKAVENLNLTDEAMQLILNFAKRHVLLDLKNCISQYL